MKVDWCNAPDGAEYAGFDTYGCVYWYCVFGGELMYFNGKWERSIFNSICEVSKFRCLVERPIKYPNPLMKYIGCEVVYTNYNMSGFEGDYTGFVTGVHEDWVFFGIDCIGVIWLHKNHTMNIRLVNEDGSLVQLGKEDW